MVGGVSVRPANEADWDDLRAVFSGTAARCFCQRYKLPRGIMNAISGVGARGVTLSLIGRNLLTFTDYKGYDPEVSSSNAPTVIKLDSFSYPRYRTFTGAVQVEF